MFFHDGDREILFTGENTFITKSAFLERFGKVHDYQTLMNHANTTDEWKSRFDWLKEQGILK